MCARTRTRSTFCFLPHPLLPPPSPGHRPPTPGRHPRSATGPRTYPTPSSPGRHPRPATGPRAQPMPSSPRPLMSSSLGRLLGSPLRSAACSFNGHDVPSSSCRWAWLLLLASSTTDSSCPRPVSVCAALLHVCAAPLYKKLIICCIFIEGTRFHLIQI
jgi:hypothetical protein